MSTDLEIRLKELILTKYKSLREFTIAIDMPYSTLDTILKRGVNKANISNIISLCKELNIDVEELSKGNIIFKNNLSDVNYNEDLKPPSSKSIRLVKVFNKLNDLGQNEAVKRVEELTQIDKYTAKENSYLLPDAAHEIEGASDEDKAHDDAIMDSDDF